MDDFQFIKPAKVKNHSSPQNLILICLVFIFLVFSVFAPIYLKLALLDIFFSVPLQYQSLNVNTNILLLGADAANRIHRSDTIMVMNVNSIKREVNLISIPRDSLVVIPGRGLDKINHAFAYGGAELSRKTAEKLFRIRIPYYILVDIKGLENIVDNLGGVPIEVEKRMYYSDYAGGLSVDLYAGPQILNGKKALSYVRFRHDNEGDFGRIKRQQKFLRAMSETILKRENLLKAPAIFLNLMSKVETNLNTKQILSLSSVMREAREKDSISMHSLDGWGIMIDGIYYYKLDEKSLDALSRCFLGGGGNLPERKESE